MADNMEEVVLKAVAKKVIGKIDTDKLAENIAQQLEKKLPKLVMDYLLEDRDYLYDAIGDTKIMSLLMKKLEKDVAKKLGAEDGR